MRVQNWPAAAASSATQTVAGTNTSRESGSGPPMSRAACSEHAAGAAHPAFDHFAGVDGGAAIIDALAEAGADGLGKRRPARFADQSPEAQVAEIAGAPGRGAGGRKGDDVAKRSFRPARPAPPP
jgi:hypothetical protein